MVAEEEEEEEEAADLFRGPVFVVKFRVMRLISVRLLFPRVMINAAQNVDVTGIKGRNVAITTLIQSAGVDAVESGLMER